MDTLHSIANNIWKNVGAILRIPDSIYLKVKYRIIMGKPLNLDYPKTFNEKLQWLKIHDRKIEYIKMVDKYAAKRYVSSKIGKQYIIPTLGVWDCFDDINFDELPAQFVLKCTHDSGGVVICKDKTKLDYKLTKRIIQKSLKSNYYLRGREWPYKKVRPRIIAETYMEDSKSSDLVDYKFYCFDGKPMYCQVICNRSEKETIDFFDMNWEHQEFTGLGLPSKPFCENAISCPINFESMKNFSQILSAGVPFLRVDYYEINGILYFGELTFYPASGFGSFKPDLWNRKMGELIVIPEERA